MATARSLGTLYTPRIRPIQSTVSDPALQVWMREVTQFANAQPNLSVFSFPTPNSHVTAQAPALAFNLVPASVASTIWFKQVGSGMTGWLPIA